MNARSKIIITVAATVALFILSAAWSVVSAGAGHGSYIPLLALFPYSAVTMALMTIAGNSLYELKIPLVVALAILQFAIYGFAIGKAWLKGSPKKAAIVVIASHAGVLLCIGLVFFFER